MKRFIPSEDRSQRTLLAECLEDYVDAENPVRVIDVFVEHLDLSKLGFSAANALKTGRPGYHPSTLLKLYLYGYVNRVQSSRRLERETQRNLEVMWLTGRLMPDFKTIADFRKDNGQAIRRVCRQFVLVCGELKLFSEEVAIDGSKFKAVNNRDKNFTSAKMQRRLRQIEESIERYLGQLDTADRQEPSEGKTKKVARLQDKIASLKDRMSQLQALDTQMQSSPDKQLSVTDPDARSMNTREGGIVGYNVQTAVETQHHLIVDHEVVNTGNDRDQLADMAKRAREATGSKQFTVIADRGYFDSEQIRTCELAGIQTLVPKSLTSRSKLEGRFTKQDFVYVEEDDEFRCPAGQRLTKRFETVEHGMNMHVYWHSGCTACAIKGQCTTGTLRRVKRWEHEAVIDKMLERLDRAPEKMRVRRQTVEHPFGTMKAWMGATHFLTKTLPRVRTEMSLHVLAYNLKRVMRILGVAKLIEAMGTMADLFKMPIEIAQGT